MSFLRGVRFLSSLGLCDACFSRECKGNGSFLFRGCRLSLLLLLLLFPGSSARFLLSLSFCRGWLYCPLRFGNASIFEYFCPFVVFVFHLAVLKVIPENFAMTAPPPSQMECQGKVSKQVFWPSLHCLDPSHCQVKRSVAMNLGWGGVFPTYTAVR